MPLPLGHAAIGVAIYSCARGTERGLLPWRKFLFVAILANLPDIDVLFGLVMVGNGSVFHRGPTHSFLFALLAALLVSRVWKLGSAIPKVGFLSSFVIILSHVVADAAFTSAPVSFFWPLDRCDGLGHTRRIQRCRNRTLFWTAHRNQ